jgi:hypothetical protein
VRVYVAAARVAATLRSQRATAARIHSTRGISCASPKRALAPRPRTATVVLIWHPADPTASAVAEHVVRLTSLVARRSIRRRGRSLRTRARRNVSTRCVGSKIRHATMTSNTECVEIAGTVRRARMRAKLASTNLRTTRGRVNTRTGREAEPRAMASPTQSPQAVPLPAIVIMEAVGGPSGVVETETVARARRTTIAEDARARLERERAERARLTAHIQLQHHVKTSTPAYVRRRPPPHQTETFSTPPPPRVPTFRARPRARVARVRRGRRDVPPGRAVRRVMTRAGSPILDT